jgi:hypothetical protein
MKIAAQILLFLACFISRAQDTLTYSKMKTDQYQAWDTIERKWRTEKFMPFLKKENIKMNCANCTSVYVWLVFKIDSLGSSYKIMRNKKCADEFKGRQLKTLEKLLNEIKFPAVFINTYFKVMLGNGLKC